MDLLKNGGFQKDLGDPKMDPPETEVSGNCGFLWPTQRSSEIGGSRSAGVTAPMGLLCWSKVLVWGKTRWTHVHTGTGVQARGLGWCQWFWIGRVGFSTPKMIPKDS